MPELEVITVIFQMSNLIYQLNILSSLHWLDCKVFKPALSELSSLLTIKKVQGVETR